MTKFAKGVITIGLLAVVGVGGKYGYDYLNDNGYLDKIKEIESNVSQEEIDDIDKFLNDKYNLGFTQINYDSMDVNKIEFSKLVSIINNKYVIEDEYLKQIEFSKTDAFRDFVYDYNPSINNYKICYDVIKLSEYIHTITNQYLDAAQNTPTLCIYSIGEYFYALNLNIDKVLFKDNIYNVYYTMYDINGIFYCQKYDYNMIDVTKSYKGTLQLSKIDNRYIFLSNNIDGGNDIYSK